MRHVTLLASAISVATAAVAAAPALAQIRDPADSAVESPATGRTLSTPSPLTTAAVRTAVPAVFLSAVQGKVDVKLQAGARVGWSPVFGRLTFTAEATAPLNHAETRPILFGLSGLNAGTTVDLALTGVKWNRPAPEATVRDWCDESKREGRLPETIKCSELDYSEIPSSIRAEYLRVSGFRRPPVYNATLSLDRAEFDYLDPKTLESATAAHTSVSAGVDYGGFVGAALWTVGARYEHAYNAVPKKDVCTPLEATAGALVCRTVSLGAPTEQRNTIFAGQLKLYLSQHVATNPRVSYRARDKAWAIEAPLFFVTDDADGLIGGVQPRWNSIDQKTVIGIFVGKPFRLDAK